jgi:hypothetical protein
MASKIVIILTAGYLTAPGQITERSEEIELNKIYATTEACRKALRSDDRTYRAMKNAVNDLRTLVDAQYPNKPVIRIGERANCQFAQ